MMKNVPNKNGVCVFFLSSKTSVTCVDCLFSNLDNSDVTLNKKTLQPFLL